MTKQRKTLKNRHIESIASSLCSIDFVANFINVSKNSIHLRIHFDNFVKPVKINGKLYFYMNDILDYIKKDSEEEAFAYLVRDEIRTMIDCGVIDREYIGNIIGSPKPMVAGGNIYLRPISYKRAKYLKEYLEKDNKKFDILTDNYTIQKSNRLKYIYEIWDIILKQDIDTIIKYINRENYRRVKKSILSQGPSYKVAKLIHLYMVKSDILL